MPAVDLKGSLAFCLHSGLEFDVLKFLDSIFHFLMKPGDGRVDFLFSFVYRPPLWRNKEAFWEDLADLGGSGDQSWVYIGDFNDIVKPNEKRGGRAVIVSYSRGL